MHMNTMDAPDIRWDTLSGESESDEHSSEDELAGEDSATMNHGEYGFDAFRSAVVDGEHPDGEALHSDMPRWRMTDADLRDVAEFLKGAD